MYEQQLNEIKLYLKPKGNVLLLVLGIFMVFMGCFVFTAEIEFIICLLPLLLGLFLVAVGVHALMDYPQYIQSLKNSGQIPQIYQDFSTAQSVYQDKLRFGRYGLFARNHGKIIFYNDITRVYQYIHRTNFVEDRRELKFINRKGHELTLCPLKTRGRSDEDMHLIVAMLLQKNPSIQVGYHK